ncbi:SMI1/KNR4 family protein [Colwellia sp. BRX8-9]|uniref:SMI1/KNR4 family protein n=1 Tax=Colwellia sp. BRX8-9 TaxID=2759831 RepID=UPI0015F64A90|nr:SMI1/KNR4 family protein [Colwellia sp. BRX8-9]MBA6350074.1 SMI1/KNR4 family protein [Colwellia sp. BRX8-9]
MNRVEKYINENTKDFLIKGSTPKSEISDAQLKLGFSFDFEYTTYLNNYGILSYESMEILGLGVPDSSYLNVVTSTLKAIAEWGQFPQNAVVLENIGEDNYAIMIMDKGVFQFSPSSLDLITNTLESYLLLRFSEVV